MQFEDLNNVDFEIHGLKWWVSCVPEDNEGLKPDIEGESILGRTFYKTCHIYIDKDLQPTLFRQILLHELLHAFTFSYGVHLKADETDEEVIADFFGAHGDEMVEAANQIIKKFKDKGDLDADEGRNQTVH